MKGSMLCNQKLYLRYCSCFLLVFFTILLSLLLDKSDHREIVHYMSDEVPSSECAEFNEIHSMFHFMAIVTPYKESQIQLAQRETIPHLLAQYTPPHKKTSYTPPTS